MSLLSNPRGKPEHVLSLLRLLGGLGGRAPGSEVLTWLMPASFRANENSIVQVHEVIGCAKGLQFIRSDGEDLVLDQALTVPADPLAFADLVHERLRDVPSEPDRVVFLVYACMVLETVRAGGTDWIEARSAKEIANEVNAVLQKAAGPGAERAFNDTKYPAWRNWMVALGLGFESGKVLPSFFPYPAERLARELPHIARSYGYGREIPAQAFVSAVARRMPYLDGGAVFVDVASRLGWQPKAGWVTNVLSEALRDLHDDSLLHLVERADAPDALSLAQDLSSPLRSFVGVVIPEGGTR